jgi:hypothetical protein
LDGAFRLLRAGLIDPYYANTYCIAVAVAYLSTLPGVVGARIDELSIERLGHDRQSQAAQQRRARQA